MSETLTSVEAQLVVTDWMELNGFTSVNWSMHPEAGVRLYARTPVLDPDDLRNIKSIADLDAKPGWLPISGNMTAKSHRDEMGPLYYEQNVNPDHTSYTITLHNAPESGTGPWPQALVENSRGWEVTTGVVGIEQETVAAAAWYIKGVHGGVEDPVLMITDQGLSGGMIIRGGAMYGMTQYDPSIPPSVLTWTLPSNPLVPVHRQVLAGWVGTINVSTPHHFAEGDLVRITIWGLGPTINQLVRVSNVIDPYTFQTRTPVYIDHPTDYIFTDIPFALAYTTLVNRTYKVGTVLLDTPAKAYEPTNAVHVWLRPQRMNLLVNPSFEGSYYEGHTRTFGWKSNGWMIGGVPSEYLSVFEGLDSTDHGCLVVNEEINRRLIVESNRFPVVENNFIGLNVGLAGRGTARIGVVAWNSYYNNPTFIRLPEINVDNAVFEVINEVNGMLTPIEGTEIAFISGLLPVLPGSVEYSLRIEWYQDEPLEEEISAGFPPNGSLLMMTNPIVDPTDGVIDERDFFNGDSTDGLPGDYHWHGGVPHQHFSMWYNNRKNIESRLFGGVDADTDTYTEGLLSDWTPSSAAVIPHWDAIEGSPVEGWQGNYFYPIKDVHDELVLLNPWQEYDHHLRPFYPYALTTEAGGLIRDDFGEPINLVYGERPDDILVNESGQPITDGDGNYIVVA